MIKAVAINDQINCNLLKTEQSEHLFIGEVNV